MTKQEFIKELGEALASLKPDERKSTVSYYSELIDDRMEAGESEEDITAGMASPADIAAEILAGSPEVKKTAPARSAGATAALIVGSPLWLALFCAGAAVIFALAVSAWAVIVSFWACDFAFAVSGLASLAGFGIRIAGDPASAFMILGAGMVCTAFCLALYPAVLKLTVLLAKLCGAIPGYICNLFRRKDGRTK